MKTKTMARALFVGVLATGAASLAGVSGLAAQDFYAGKTVNLYIGYSAGGGYDLYARLLARHIVRHIPGQPTMVPSNMPGAGGLKVANYMYSVAPKDGTALATTSEGAAIEQALQGPGVEYDASKFAWIGMMTGSATLFFTWHTSPTKSLADLQKRETFFGSTGANNIDYMPRALNRLGGTQFKLITGYQGSNDVMLAVERGELEGGFALWTDFRVRKEDWLRERKIHPVLVIAPKRLPDLPDVPTVIEAGTSEENKQVIALMTEGELGRSIFTTPGVPADRVALLRGAFSATMKDPAFLDEAKKSAIHIEPMSGDEVQAIVTRVVNAPKELTAKAAAARRQ